MGYREESYSVKVMLSGVKLTRGGLAIVYLGRNLAMSKNQEICRPLGTSVKGFSRSTYLKQGDLS